MTDVFGVYGLSLNGQSFGALNQVYVDPMPVDGLIGLGTPVGEDPDFETPSTPIYNIKDQLVMPAYTLWLNSYILKDGGNIAGQFTLGAYDNDHCSPDRNTVKQFTIDTDMSWLFYIDSVKIGSSYTKKAKKYAFVQTDFPALLATTSEYNYIVKVTNPTYNWTDAVNYVQCDQVLPDVVFSIGGVDYTVPGETYKARTEKGACVLAVETENEDDIWVLGVPFLQTYCATINFVDHTATLAKAIAQP